MRDWSWLSESLCSAPPHRSGLGDDVVERDEIALDMAVCRQAIEEAAERAYGMGLARCGRLSGSLADIRADAARAAVTRHGSVAEAARRLGVARSSVYAWIRRDEGDLGFRRQKR